MDEMVMITREQYEDLVDTRDHANAMRKVAANGALVAESEMDDYLAAPSALAYFRRRAGLTQADLAKKADVSQPYLAQLEQGRRKASVKVYLRLAQLLGVLVEDLADED